jgi:hypothetical protein
MTSSSDVLDRGILLDEDDDVIGLSVDAILNMIILSDEKNCVEKSWRELCDIFITTYQHFWSNMVILYSLFVIENKVYSTYELDRYDGPNLIDDCTFRFMYFIQKWLDSINWKDALLFHKYSLETTSKLNFCLPPDHASDIDGKVLYFYECIDKDFENIETFVEPFYKFYDSLQWIYDHWHNTPPPTKKDFLDLVSAQKHDSQRMTQFRKQYDVKYGLVSNLFKYTNIWKQFHMDTYNPICVATHLVAIDEIYFHNIIQSDLFNSKQWESSHVDNFLSIDDMDYWMDKNNGVSIASYFWTMVSFWVSLIVYHGFDWKRKQRLPNKVALSGNHHNEREKSVKLRFGYFLEVLEEVINLGAFNIGMAIFMGLLSVDYECKNMDISKKYSTFERFQKLFSPAKNYGEYRKVFHRSKFPKIPFIGCITKDLIAVEELESYYSIPINNNNDKQDDSMTFMKFCSWQKMTALYPILTDYRECARVSYVFDDDTIDEIGRDKTGLNEMLSTYFLHLSDIIPHFTNVDDIYTNSFYSNTTDIQFIPIEHFNGVEMEYIPILGMLAINQMLGKVKQYGDPSALDSVIWMQKIYTLYNTDHPQTINEIVHSKSPSKHNNKHRSSPFRIKTKKNLKLTSPTTKLTLSTTKLTLPTSPTTKSNTKKKKGDQHDIMVVQQKKYRLSATITINQLKEDWWSMSDPEYDNDRDQFPFIDMISIIRNVNNTFNIQDNKTKKNVCNVEIHTKYIRDWVFIEENNGHFVEVMNSVNTNHCMTTSKRISLLMNCALILYWNWINSVNDCDSFTKKTNIYIQLSTTPYQLFLRTPHKIELNIWLSLEPYYNTDFSYKYKSSDMERIQPLHPIYPLVKPLIELLNNDYDYEGLFNYPEMNCWNIQLIVGDKVRCSYDKNEINNSLVKQITSPNSLEWSKWDVLKWMYINCYDIEIPEKIPIRHMRYMSVLLENEVDGNILSQLDVKKLKRMGIKHTKDIQVILREIEKINDVNKVIYI